MKKRLLSLALALVICLSLLSPTVFAAGGGPVSINATNFPDGNFRAYVRTLPGAEDNVFTQEELAAITEINCSVTTESGPQQIFVLTGIEHFTALTRLYCDNNVLTTLDLSKNTKLTDLSCSDNQLKSLELGNTDNLVTLDCHNNQLTRLELGNTDKLVTLDCHKNQLTSLELGNTDKLVALDCHNNQLTTLDLSKNTKLTDLSCYNNRLSSLELGNTDKLATLDCHNNLLTSLDVSQHTTLTDLDCHNNQLTSLDVSQHTALTDLDCSDNRLKSLDLRKNTALTILDYTNNQLTSLDLSQNPQLRTISYGNNQRAVANGTALAAMDPNFDSSKVSNIVGGSFSGGRVYFNADELTYVYDCGLGKTASFKLVNATPQSLVICDKNFPDANFLAYVKTLPGAEDGSFTQEELAAITEIDCNGSEKSLNEKIADLSGIEYFSALTHLDCSYNILTELDLPQNTRLEHLASSYNQLTSVNLSNNINLSYLDVSTNQLTSLDFSQNPKLTDLDCSVNMLTSLNLSQNTQLTRLNCYYNQLPSLDLSQNTRMTDLDCHINNLTGLDLSQNTQLTYLYCENNQLTSLDLSKNPELTQLYCGGNRRTVANGTALTALDPNFDPSKASSIVGGSFDNGKIYFTADKLTYRYDCGNGKTAYFTLIKVPQRLAIDGTNFPDKNFLAYMKTLPGAEDHIFTDAELSAITEIDCNGENKPEEEKIADLAGIEYFTALTKLNCSCNKLTRLDVSKNPKLTQLSCSENSLTSLDLSKNPQLTQLYCDNNRRTVDNGTELTAMDPNFDPAKVGNIADGSFDGDKVNFTTEEMIYTYDCGNGHTASFKLFKTPPVMTMATITFQVVNGTWADGSTTEKTAMVAMYDGLGTLCPEQVPIDMIANPGYENGTWNKSPNVTPGAVTESVTYIYSFTETAAPTFVDVKPTDWFYQGVQYTTARGLFKGISPTEFGPTLPMTRSMVVQVLYSMAGKPKVEKTNQFVDVKDSDWFADAVAWGVENGVTAGYPGGRFAPNDEVNREQLAVMLHGFMKKPAATKPLTFADNDAISSWARNAVQWVVENHMMGGVPGNKILPQGLAERSQGAVIMMNFDQMPKN